MNHENHEWTRIPFSIIFLTKVQIPNQKVLQSIYSYHQSGDFFEEIQKDTKN
jgi:hypothetical protein